MRRRIQVVVSLMLFYVGSIISVYHAGQYSARFECDTRYHAHIEALRTNLLGAELEEFFNAKGQERYADYSINFLTYKPSGKLYKGYNERAAGIFGGSILCIFGLLGFLDTFRRKKNG